LHQIVNIWWGVVMSLWWLSPFALKAGCWNRTV